MMLALAFKHKRRNGDNHALPMPFAKRDDAPIVAPKPKRVALDMSVNVSAVRDDVGALAVAWHGQRAHLDNGVMCHVMAKRWCDTSVGWRYAVALNRDDAVRWGKIKRLTSCNTWRGGLMARLDVSQAVVYGRNVRLRDCLILPNNEMARLSHLGAMAWSASDKLGGNQAVWWQLGRQALCQMVHVSRSVQPPCDWYPIVLDPPITPTRRPCGEKPHTHRLPLAFKRKSKIVSPTQVPLPFSCNADFNHIPPLDSYMILNKITATTEDGIALDPLAFSAKADMSGYCWSFNLTLSPDDFIKLNMLGRKIGEEAVITLDINHDRFTFLAEDFGDNRQFPSKSYTVTGRSLTSRLGADYALGQQGVIDDALYASQIAQMQVALVAGYTLEWETVDWLIPANTYTLTDKTPIGVIQDLAQASGSFVYSHPHERKLYVKPRWRVPAWNVSSASPAVIVPSNIILSASGRKSVKTQCYGVFVWGTTSDGVATNITRKGSDGEPRASALSHAVYTDLKVCEAVGIATLSDSGNHKSEDVTLPIAYKYGLGLAEIGRVWQFMEMQQAWQGVIQGVDVSVSVRGDVPVVEQRVSVDRYLGD